jgi:hypothetical protein
MKKISTSLKIWIDHGTKLLGIAQAIVSGLMVIPDFVPKEDWRWWAAANVVLGVLTVQRGVTNSKVTADRSNDAAP